MIVNTQVIFYQNLSKLFFVTPREYTVINITKQSTGATKTQLDYSITSVIYNTQAITKKLNGTNTINTQIY